MIASLFLSAHSTASWWELLVLEIVKGICLDDTSNSKQQLSSETDIIWQSTVERIGNWWTAEAKVARFRHIRLTPRRMRKPKLTATKIARASDWNSCMAHLGAAGPGALRKARVRYSTVAGKGLKFVG
jgi:hypothetical protein